MKQALIWPLAALTIFLAASPVVAIEDTVVIEEAWLVPEAASGSALLYLVINNRTTGDVVLSSVQTPAARTVRLLRPSGKEIVGGALVPMHAELYMQPGGVRVALSDLVAPLTEGQSVPVQVMLEGGLSAVIDATVLREAAPTPDHHDYKH